MEKVTIEFSPPAAFSYTWNSKGPNHNPLARLMSSTSSFIKAVFCGYAVALKDAITLMNNGHRNAIFVRRSVISEYIIKKKDNNNNLIPSSHSHNNFSIKSLKK